jgi:hypothetical protein
MAIQVSEELQKTIDKKREGERRYKKYQASEVIRKLGLSLSEEVLRARNPFADQSRNLTLQGYLTEHEASLAAELKAAALAPRKEE